MTELHRPTSANAIPTEHKNLSPEEELHHIAELLEDLIVLLKDSNDRNNGILSEEPSTNDSEVMTIKEAAAMLRISLPTMYEFARSGKIHSMEIGRKILVSRSSILALLREGENNGKQKR